MVYVAPKPLTCDTPLDRLSRLSVMRIGRANYLAITALAVLIAFIAKDLAVPLFVISLMGLFDRLIGEPVLRARSQ